MAERHLPALLVIMDGFGLAPAGDNNAVFKANKPYLDKLWEEYPHTTLGASGEDVGLPPGARGRPAPLPGRPAASVVEINA